MSFVMFLAFLIFVLGISLTLHLLTAFGVGTFLGATLGRNWDH